MLSSTFTDLSEHRQRAIEAISKLHYIPSVMEHSGAQAETDVMDTSLRMVRDAAAYIGVISLKYGQTPFDPVRNPNRLSITELEFNEALRLGRPIVLFIMGPNHLVKQLDIEADPEKRRKLDQFRDRAKLVRDGSEVQRVYEVFDSLEQFAEAAAIALGNLARFLERTEGAGRVAPDSKGPLGGSSRDGRTPQDEVFEEMRLPEPPALAALPRYLGSHPFVGRSSELDILSDWCGAADPNSMLLLEAIGGSGKSMLTWEWLTKHATGARDDWAGLFWYSFYEKGAVMADFCCHALAYMTQREAALFRKLRPNQLFKRVLAELETRPWLLVLDGLERVLVAYHRHDAAQLLDTDVDITEDQIQRRDPCAAIRPEDDEFLRKLTCAAPSKILVSSRLTPKALINSSRTTVPGVRRQLLAGLRPADAEEMLRSCGIAGNSRDIRDFLQKNCDCHPLVVGALAGLISDYLPDRGNFDRWATDPNYGRALNLGALDLVQRQNHILVAAIDSLDVDAKRLLHLLSLLSSAADFHTLGALVSPYNVRDIGNVIRDLERRGLLQYDAAGKSYDLHPVVRGVAAGRIGQEETRRIGQRLVDHFTSRPHDPWDNADKLEDVADGIQVVSAFIRMERYPEAFWAFEGDLANALHFNIGAHAEMLSLARGFFPNGWDGEPALNEPSERWYILNLVAASLPRQRSLDFFERAVLTSISGMLPDGLFVSIQGLSNALSDMNCAADVERLSSLASELADVARDPELHFVLKLRQYSRAAEVGDTQRADTLWEEIEQMGRNWKRGNYRPGDAEGERALDLFARGKLTVEVLSKAEELAERGKNRRMREVLHNLRGEWHLAEGEPDLAIDHFSRALTLFRERGVQSTFTETRLLLARLRARQIFDAKSEAERLSAGENVEYLAVAEVWLEMGDREKAIEHAKLAYCWAAKCRPLVAQRYLNGATEILEKLAMELPVVLDEPSSAGQVFPWEKEASALIAKLRAQTANSPMAQ